MYEIINLNTDRFPDIKNGVYNLKEISSVFTCDYSCIACSKDLASYNKDEIVKHIQSHHSKLFEMKAFEDRSTPSLSDENRSAISLESEMKSNEQIIIPTILHQPSTTEQNLDLKYKIFNIFNQGGSMLRRIQEFCEAMRFGPDTPYKDRFVIIDRNFRLTDHELCFLNPILKGLTFYVIQYYEKRRYVMTCITGTSIGETNVLRRNVYETLLDRFRRQNWYFASRNTHLLPNLPAIEVAQPNGQPSLYFPLEAACVEPKQFPSVRRSRTQSSDRHTEQQSASSRYSSHFDENKMKPHREINTSAPRIKSNPQNMKISHILKPPCNICGENIGDKSNKLMHCRGSQSCTVSAHENCYDIPENMKFWRCDKCILTKNGGDLIRCELCPNEGGALKYTKDKTKLAHVVCAYYMPGAKQADKHNKGAIILNHVPKEFYYKTCSICVKRGKTFESTIGACIKCLYRDCDLSFHVTCAQSDGLLRRMHLGRGGYCSEHAKSVYPLVFMRRFVPTFKLARKVEDRKERSPSRTSDLVGLSDLLDQQREKSSLKRKFETECDENSNKKDAKLSSALMFETSIYMNDDVGLVSKYRGETQKTTSTTLLDSTGIQQDSDQSNNTKNDTNNNVILFNQSESNDQQFECSTQQNPKSSEKASLESNQMSTKASLRQDDKLNETSGEKSKEADLQINNDNHLKSDKPLTPVITLSNRTPPNNNHNDILTNEKSNNSFNDKSSKIVDSLMNSELNDQDNNLKECTESTSERTNETINQAVDKWDGSLVDISSDEMPTEQITESNFEETKPFMFAKLNLKFEQEYKNLTKK